MTLSPESELVRCVACGRRADVSGLETASVRSNVRAFSQQQFRVWRCAGCSSIHARESVDLGYYYASYPFHALARDARTHVVHGKLLSRLREAGLTRAHSVLDYGCGGGHFVQYLRERGYAGALGFDAYHPDFARRELLGLQYDHVVSQDVIEHAEEPRELLEHFRAMTRPGSRLTLGTPNADAIDLQHPEQFVHTLHAPYHRHILSKKALIDLVERSGFRLRSFYDTMYTNTVFPGLNEAFYIHYARLTDDTLDAILGPVQVGPMLRTLPSTLFWALFGAAFSRGTDCMAVFERV